MHDHHHHGHRHGHGQRHNGHGHDGHAHAAPPARFDQAFAIGIALNGGFALAEAGCGLAAHSTALLSDALHNLGDTLGLGLGWGAALLSRRPPSARRTYGFGRSSILAALANAVTLMVGIGAVASGAARQLLFPEPVAAGLVAAVAVCGIAVNALTAWLFSAGRRHDLNLRAAFQHMAADAALAAGVVAAAIVALATGWRWPDPAVGLLIAALLLGSSWRLLRRSMDLALDAVPETIDRDAAAAYLRALPGVAALHDLHIWAISTTECAMTAHLVMPGHPGGDAFLAEVRREMARRFGIRHLTVQVEGGDAAFPCPLAPDDVV